MKKLLSFHLIFALLFSSIIFASAADTPSPKEEVIYGILDLDGNVNSLHVVNIFNGGSIIDYGDYSQIRNMSTSEALTYEENRIYVDTTAEKFYYQGTLTKKELPWNIDIKYFLDDKQITGNELGGKSGKLKISLSVIQNNKIDSTFFDNYALQIALSLDNKLCSNIVTENATLAEAGSKKQLSYTILPGNGADINIEADVHDFEMDPITINGIRLTLGIDLDNEEITGQIMELINAIKEIDDGASELLEGLSQLSDGMQEYTNGMRAFSLGIGELSKGADKLNLGAGELKNGLSQLASQNDSLVQGALEIQKATFDSVNAQLGATGLNVPDLTPENYASILPSIPGLSKVKNQLDGVIQFTQGISAYTNGVTQLSGGASDLEKGTAEFKSSTSQIASSANQLYKSGAQLNEAVKKLHEGLSAYNEGTKKLRAGTLGIDLQINDKIDEILENISGTGDKIVSFVSDKNTNISAVQFVLKTEPIDASKPEQAPAPEPAKLNFWQKLLKLFGLYKG